MLLCIGNCTAQLLPNGDFQLNIPGDIDAKLWTRFKEKGTKGSIKIYDGRTATASGGFPGAPFAGNNVYARSNVNNHTGVVLVNDAPFTVDSADQMLYFDWFVDNMKWNYIIPDTMSWVAGANATGNQQVRVDLYDASLLPIPNNVTSLKDIVFDPKSSTAGAAWVGNVLKTDKAFAVVPDLKPMGYSFPLKDYVGKKLHLAFRVVATHNALTFGFDNIQLYSCKDNSTAAAA